MSTSPSGTPLSRAGVLGTPGAAAVFSGTDLDYGERSGGRFTTGVWFDRNQCIGLEGVFFMLADRDDSFAAGSTGTPILARPFLDVRTNMENALLVAYPGLLSGMVAVHSTSQLWGAEANLRTNLYTGRPLLFHDCWYPGRRLFHCGDDDCGDCCLRWDSLAGFRFLELDETLNISETESPTVPDFGFPVGTRLVIREGFETRNYFYGGQVGTELEWRRGRWSCGLLSKVAVGGTRHVATIRGSTTFNIPGAAPVTGTGGLLALPTNIGRFSTSGIAVVPELGVKLGFQLTDCLRLTVGYTFLYWSEVVRPGDAIDRGINFTQRPTVLGQRMLVGPARPVYPNRDSDFWAQGLNLGLEFRY